MNSNFIKSNLSTRLNRCSIFAIFGVQEVLKWPVSHIFLLATTIQLLQNESLTYLTPKERNYLLSISFSWKLESSKTVKKHNRKENSPEGEKKRFHILSWNYETGNVVKTLKPRPSQWNSKYPKVDRKHADKQSHVRHFLCTLTH